MTTFAPDTDRMLIDELLAEQQQLTAVERFALRHEIQDLPGGERFYKEPLPACTPHSGEQYAFRVDLDACSGCKACVTACHNRNGLEEGENWRQIGLLHSRTGAVPYLQTVTTACHHCVDPACLNGCPVLAYDKDPITGIVRHLDDQCMGCQYCVMKCPYEVPQYSTRLGIVRKCDMCANRLSAGQSTACAQACPNNAITITVVDKGELAENLKSPAQPRSIHNSFLPDSPDPQVTIPTTRFVSRRSFPKDILAADHGALRLDNPHWPLVLMLVLTQGAAGMFLFGALTQSSNVALNRTAFCTLLLGLTFSIFHLGQPLKAWRAFLGWRRSWLSREIIIFNVFAAIGFLLLASPQFSSLVSWQLRWLTAAIALASVFVSAMVYVDTRRPFWAPRFTFINFFGTTLLLGATLTALVFQWTGRSKAGVLMMVLIATVIRTGLFLWRGLELRAALRDSQSPTHFNSCIIRELLSWTMPIQRGLFAVSTFFSLLGLASGEQGGSFWVWLSALATLSSELVARYVFFAGGVSKRMPGGIAA
jgi:formate dehydrogenase iron-sulfur subunit